MRTAVGAGVAAGSALALPRLSSAGGDAVRVGSILPLSGIFDIYGKAMEMAATLAVEEINATGGVNGRPVEKITYDTQSDMALYTQYAQQLARRDRVDVVQGAVLSAAREAIRPTLRRHRTLYFYNVQYEGGVCDRNVFCTGVTPAQQAAILVPAAARRWGGRAHILAADYNYGHITAKWLARYLREAGGEVVETDFFPTSVGDFSTTISKLQRTKPDFILSVLVGAAHTGFYRQWAAAGMSGEIPIASTTLGAGNEHRALTPAEGDGILLAYTWSHDLDTPRNRAFLSAWRARFGATDMIHELAVSHYQGVHLWAAAARRAGSPARAAVIGALEEGIAIDGPTGQVAVDPRTHHVTANVHLMEVRNQAMRVLETHPGRAPEDTRMVCDLQANPDDTRQYEIDV